MTHTHDLTALSLAEAVRAKDLSPVEITDHYLERIERVNPQVGAYVTVTAERARDEARRAEKAVLEAATPAELPAFHGVPIPVKDLNMVNGVRVTLGSSVFSDLTGFADDNVVVLLREAGSVLLGKTATPEFGLPCYTESAVSPPARTPWDLSRSAGGSSGGAAAAVAAGLAPIAQGSDGGGSIRIPSSVCGLFGIKPTRGRVSQGPVVPDLFGLSTNGPIARSVRDAAALLDVMARPFPGDLYAAPPAQGTFLSYADRAPGRLRIARTAAPAVPGAEVHPDCVAAYEEAGALLEELGHEVVELPPVFGPELVPVFEMLWGVMATMTPVDPDQEHRLQPLTQWLRERGRKTSAEQLFRAHASLQAALRQALPVMNGFDAILSPTLAQPPAPVGHFHDQEPAENFERQKVFTPFCAAYNISGQPAVNVPLHWTAPDENGQGLPIGVMLAGRLGGEGTLISLAAQLEEARPWIDRKPAIWAA
ncbi:amidase [Actinomadura barringtoniae]|uniref:Amidase n=1 Tax=Actinomadura barringtoniae TaxID=1427535 RepID=A0A939P626_9ACTN|nr:amidase [Actinomadura barringtoniae]MBO2445755.1 amidase [Actinomadura barringtoniae]